MNTHTVDIYIVLDYITHRQVVRADVTVRTAAVFASLCAGCRCVVIEKLRTLSTLLTANKLSASFGQVSSLQVASVCLCVLSKFSKQQIERMGSRQERERRGRRREKKAKHLGTEEAMHADHKNGWLASSELSASAPKRPGAPRRTRRRSKL